MVENRYGDLLVKGNQEIIVFNPANFTTRIELALELRRIVGDKKDIKILELGCGEGDQTKYILEKVPGIKIDCLDISEEMIKSAKIFLSEYPDRINFIVCDALEYLESLNFKYDVIFSAWTLHNFSWESKKKVFEKIYTSLGTNGKFLLMDKLYPDNKKEQEILLALQLKRYNYLSEDLREEISNHEMQDYLDDYRMEESQSINVLKEMGFKNVKILDRLERDVLLIAERN